jgi:serine/threonine protein kinase
MHASNARLLRLLPADLRAGQLTQKVDSYAFGIVLLELLTGQLPYDAKRSEKDILTYMEDVIDEVVVQGNAQGLLKFVDPSAGDCPLGKAVQLIGIAKRCLARKKERCTVHEVLPELELLAGRKPLPPVGRIHGPRLSNAKSALATVQELILNEPPNTSSTRYSSEFEQYDQAGQLVVSC